MICKKCGREISDDVTVCPECGEIFETEETEETIDTAETIEEAQADTEQITDEGGEEIDNASDEAVEDDADETEEPDEIEETEENYGEIAETSDVTEESVEPGKKSGISKIITAAAVIVIVALAIFAGYNEIFGKTEKFEPFIYLKETESGKNVCINDYNGKEFTLIKNFADGGTFSQNSNFITGGKNMFYLDDGTLKLYVMGKDEAEVISKDVLSSSVVISADDKTVLFVKGKDDKNTLCTYTAGKKATEITKLDKVKYATGGAPCYGFLKGTSKAWYVKIKDDTKAGELVADGKSIAKNVSGVEYISADAKNIVYTTKDGDTEKLNIIENGGKASVLAEGDAAAKPVYYVETPAKGVIYMSDVTKSESGESMSSSSSGTLYYREFGKKSKAIDTEVSVYAMARTMSARGTGSYDDGMFDDGNDIVLYMQKEEIRLANGGENIALPEGFSYGTANPVFSKDGSRLIYLNSDESLVYSDLKNGKWSEPVTIVKADAVCAATNDSADMIAYVVTDGDGNDTKNALSLYSVEEKGTYKLTDNTVSSPYFAKDGKTLYYTDNLDSEKGSAAINYSTNGAKGTVIDKEINGFASGLANDPIIFKLADESGQKIDIYTVKDGKLSEVAKNVVNVFYY